MTALAVLTARHGILAAPAAGKPELTTLLVSRNYSGDSQATAVHVDLTLDELVALRDHLSALITKVAPA